MTTETEDPAVVQTEEQPTDAEAMASMMAGYNRQKGVETEAAPAAAEPAVEPAPAAEPAPEPAPQPPSVDEQLATFRTQVNSDVAKVHGKIGELNRSIQQLLQRQQAPATAAEKAEVSADIAEALANAEKVAEEFPDLAGPLVATMKALSTRQPAAQPQAPVNIDEVVAARVQAARRADAIEILAEDHADWETYKLGAKNNPPEFKEWYKSLPAERQAKYASSENPQVISKFLTEYKSWSAEKAKAAADKQRRLTSAITPQGEGTPAGPSVLPDSAGLSAGYNKVKRLRTAA